MKHRKKHGRIAQGIFVILKRNKKEKNPFVSAWTPRETKNDDSTHTPQVQVHALPTRNPTQPQFFFSCGIGIEKRSPTCLSV